MKNRRSQLLGLLAGLSLFAFACQTAQKHPAPVTPGVSQAPQPNINPSPKPETAGPPEPFGPFPPSPEPIYGPEPIQLRPVTLVLGPGLARGFAHLGVLRALEEARVPIAAIYGSEMGALVAILYGETKTINELDWAALKLKPELFISPNRLLTQWFKKENPGSDLEEVLDRIFNSKDIKEARVSLRPVIEKVNHSEVQIFEDGKAAVLARAVVSVPDLISPSNIAGELSCSAGARKAYPVQEAKTAHPNSPILVVDVMDRSQTKNQASELSPKLRQYLDNVASQIGKGWEDVDLIIRPDLKGFSYLDYTKRTEASYRGKVAVESGLPRIKQLVGMP